MLYAFIDESEREEYFYFLGAVVADERQRAELTVALDALMLDFSKRWPQVNAMEEFHGSAIMRAVKEPWRSIPFRARTNLYRRALILIEQSGVKVFIEGIDRERHLARDYQVHLDARELTFGWLLEQVNRACYFKEPSVKVIADQHHTEQNSHSNFNHYRVSGTLGYRSSTLSRIEPPLVFIPSHLDRGLQAVDLVTYLFNRTKTVVEKDERTARLKLELWSHIEAATRYPRGRVHIWPS